VRAGVAAKLYASSGAERWGLGVETFRAALDASVAHAFGGRPPSDAERDRYLASVHVADLALAAACAAGLEPAWNHFVLTHRPALYRAADAIDPSGGARDLADSLYADLYGLREREGERQSLFRYFHGRSKLGTWLAAVLSQRHVDRLRSGRRLEPLPEDDARERSEPILRDRAATAPDPERPRFVAIMRQALTAAIAALAPRDRLRLVGYYAQDMTLAAIGRMLGEHEATVSRHLTRTRAGLRAGIEARLRAEGLDDRAIAECIQSVVHDAGTLDVTELMGSGPPSRDTRSGAPGKVSAQDRSR
jgi:RNA polymerase sigma-70 factor (ECF subfamily)